MRQVAGGGLVVLLALAGCAHAAETSCPGRMPGPHAGFEQMGPLPPGKLPLRGIRLFDGPPGEESQAAPAELAPDDTTRHAGVETTRWRFAGDEHVLLVCSYRDTSSYYRMALPTVPGACSMTDAPDGVVAGCQ